MDEQMQERGLWVCSKPSVVKVLARTGEVIKMKENLKVIVENFIIGLLLLYNRVVLGANRFISSPDDPTYVSVGSEARLTWEYEVNDEDLKVLVWIANDPPSLISQPGVSEKDLIFEEKGEIKISAVIPARYSGRVSVEKTGENKRTLVIRNITKGDENRYFQTLDLKLADIASGVSLLVSDANIVEHPKDALCPTFGGEVNFTCNATGTPHPNITWVKDGKEIGESNLVKVVRDGKGYSKLTIKSCGRVDVLAGYRCKATNPPDLEVFSKPAVLFFPFIANDTTLVDKHSSPSNVNGEIGMETTLICVFNGYPPPSIHWTFPEGNSVQTNGYFLTIKPLGSADFGPYTCSANGFKSRTITLKEKIEKENATITNTNGTIVRWKADPRADYYVIYGTAEGEQSFCYLAVGQTNSLRLHWDSTCEMKRGNKKKLVLTLVVRAQAQGKALNSVIYRTRVTLEAKARSLQGGFLAIVVPLAVGLLSAGLQ